MPMIPMLAVEVRKGIYYIYILVIFYVFIRTAGTYSINYNHDMFAKNFNADLTNPTVYNSLEGLKEEHVYDEIKQKEGYKDPGKFRFSFCFISMSLHSISISSSFVWLLL